MPPPQPDPAAIERLVALGGLSLVAEVARLFVEHGRGRVEQMHEAWGRGDLLGVAAAAHSLRSSSAQLGLTGLSRLAGGLDDDGHRADLAGVALGMAALDGEFQRALAALGALPLE